MEEPSWKNGPEEYSASSTTILFERPLPLLRGPVLAHSSPAPHALAFRDGRAWKSAFRSCESTIASQCEAAARIGCAMSASSKCRPPWWRNLIGPKVSDFKAREICEEREMELCLASVKGRCLGFATDKCLRSFRDAKVSARLIGKVPNPRRVENLVSFATVMDKSFWIDLMGLIRLGLLRRDLGVTNYKASDLVGFDSDIDCILGGYGENAKLK